MSDVESWMLPGANVAGMGELERQTAWFRIRRVVLTFPLQKSGLKHARP